MRDIDEANKQSYVENIVMTITSLGGTVQHALALYDHIIASVPATFVIQYNYPLMLVYIKTVCDTVDRGSVTNGAS